MAHCAYADSNHPAAPSINLTVPTSAFAVRSDVGITILTIITNASTHAHFLRAALLIIAFMFCFSSSIHFFVHFALTSKGLCRYISNFYSKSTCMLSRK